MRSDPSTPPAKRLASPRAAAHAPSAAPAEAPESLGHILVRLAQLLVVLYAFFYSIELLGGTFKLLGKDFAVSLIETTSNPFTGLFIGIVATSLVQSSSTVTSLIVGLVAGDAIGMSAAIPMILGANIGTSVTNTIVALGHMTRPQEFQRAFAGATVHDFFNLFAVALFLPLELATGLLQKSATWMQGLLIGQEGLTFQSPLKAIVKPATKATQHFFVDRISHEAAAGGILIALALVVLFVSLASLVKLMKKLILGRVEVLMHRYVFRRAWAGLLAGVIVTVLVQSSSVTTSLTVPLLAAGFVTLEQMFPVILGANIGTTITALMASLVTGSTAALTVALCHFFFNVYGMLVFYPLRSIPIACARGLGRLSQKSRAYAIAYILFVFFALPLVLIFTTR